jgi:hypothetical protein
MKLHPKNSLPSWVPPSLQSDLGYEAVARIATIIGCPTDGHGFLPALWHAIHCLSRLAELKEIPNLGEFLAAVSAFAWALQVHPELNDKARTCPDVSAERPHYRLFLERPADHHDPMTAARIERLVGALLLWQVAESHELNDHRAAPLITLTRCGTLRYRGARHWREFALGLDDDPLTLLQQPEPRYEPIKEMLDFLVPILAALPPAPVVGQTPAMVADNRIDEESAESSGQHSEPAPPIPHATCETKAEPGKIVAWQRGRSLYATIAQLAGIPSWDELLPLELRETTLRLSAILQDSGNNDRLFAALAILSLITGLPPSRLLLVPLADNGDAWLDLERRAFCWSLEQLVKRDPLDPRIAASGFRPSDVVMVYLPSMLFAVLPSGTPEGALTVQDLLPLGMSARDVEVHVARILASHVEPTDPRRSFPARFAYSFGLAILHVTGNHYLAGLVSMMFCLLAPAEAFYACVSAMSIHGVLRQTYDFLGLGEPAPISGNPWIGSPLAPTPAAYARTLDALHRKYASCITAISPRMSLERFVELFNLATACTAAGFVMMTGHRGANLPRLMWGGLYADPDLLQFCDKITNTVTDRLQCKTARMRALLDAVRCNVRSAANRFRSSHPAFADRLDEIADLLHGRHPVFFRIVRSTTSPARFVLKAVETKDIAAVLDQHDVSVNAGRHYLISQLIACSAPALLVRMLSGHSRAGGQPFVPWSGVSPLEAGGALRSLLDDIQKNLPSDWCALSSAPAATGKLVATQPPRHPRSADMIEAFCNRQQLTERRAESFDEHTLAFRAIAVRLRSELLCGAPGLAPWPSVLLCLCIVDGINVFAVLRAAWQAALERNLHRARHAILLEFRNADDRIVTMPLLPLTTIFLAEALASAPDSFESAATGLAGWLQNRVSRHRWSTSAFDALVELCDISHGAASVECPPILSFSPLSSLDAGAISRTSIARLLFGRAAITQALPVGRRHRTAGRDRHYGSAQQVFKILNKFAATAKQGEDGSRKSKLVSELDDWSRNAWLPAPEAEGYAEYFRAEAQNKGALGDPLELSSLSTYASETRSQIGLFPGLHPLEFEPDEWLEILDVYVRDHKGGDLSRALSIIRRYGRYWRSQGAAVPRDFFAGEPASEKPTYPPLRAAEAFFPAHQRERLVQAVKDCFEPGSLAQAQAALLTELLVALPARRYEPVYLRLYDFNPTTRTLSIAPSGFAHLKTGSRVITLDEALAARVLALRERISAADPKRGYFFLDANNEGSKAADEMLAVITECLRRLTGEASIRIHSLRGSAEIYRAYPDLQEILDAMAENRAPDPDPRPIAVRFIGMTRASFEAGHHPLTAMQYYFAAWPILAHAHRRRVQLTWRPSGQLADRMPGLSRDALRQMLSRRTRAHDDIWQGLGSWAVDRIGALSLEDCLVADAVPSRDDSGLQSVVEDSPVDVTRYIAFRLLAFPVTRSIDLSGVSARFAAEIDAFLASVPPLAVPRLGGGAAAMLAADFGSAVANQLSGHSDPRWLVNVVESLQEAERPGPTPVADIVLAATRLAACLPLSHTVVLLPEHASDAHVTAMQVRAAVPAFLLKEASRKPKRRFRLLVAPVRVRSARSAGECTGVVHLLLLARLTALIHMKKENHEKAS